MKHSIRVLKQYKVTVVTLQSYGVENG